jgi:hypothetical protein
MAVDVHYPSVGRNGASAANPGENVVKLNPIPLNGHATHSAVADPIGIKACPPDPMGTTEDGLRTTAANPAPDATWLCLRYAPAGSVSGINPTCW